LTPDPTGLGCGPFGSTTPTTLSDSIFDDASADDVISPSWDCFASAEESAIVPMAVSARGAGLGTSIVTEHSLCLPVVRCGFPAQLSGTPVERSIFSGTTKCGSLARRIVFVCDSSGSMMNKWVPLCAELQKAVDGLKPYQSFDIILFGSSNVAMFGGGRLQPGTPANRGRVKQFLDGHSTTGQTDPMYALAEAFRHQPDLVFLLTDGEFSNNRAVIGKIGELNKNKSAKVNTILFNESSDERADTVLRQIANENGGMFNHAKP
jgi:hypothetical protein